MACGSSGGGCPKLSAILTVVSDRYDRFAIERPAYLSDAHWSAIEVEFQRLERSLESSDAAAAIGDAKSLVEAIAKVVLEMNGTPAARATRFDSVVKQAHDLLGSRLGQHVAMAKPMANVALHASKIAPELGNIRNEHGTGHGRARQSEHSPEMLDLALDGALMWARWALRRLAGFSRTRPETLIRELIGDSTGPLSFAPGDLTQKLAAARLPHLPASHAHQIGVAVGQRTASGAVSVRREGVEPCAADPDLTRWPTAYRMGVAMGLLTSAANVPTVCADTAYWALAVIRPVLDEPEPVLELLEYIGSNVPLPIPLADPQAGARVRVLVEQMSSTRPREEKAAWRRLLGLLELAGNAAATDVPDVPGLP